MPEISQPFRYGSVAVSARRFGAVLQHPVPEDARDLADDLVRVLSEVVFDPEEDLDGEVVVENARGQHHCRDRRKAVLKAAGQLLLHPMFFHEGVEAAGQDRKSTRLNSSHS